MAELFHLLSPTMIEEYLQGLEFPVHRDKILQTAHENDVPYDVVSAFEELPDREYQGYEDISHTLLQRYPLQL